MSRIHTLLALSFLFFSSPALSQKHPLNADDISNWETINDGKISNNGDFALYTINNRPINNATLVIKKLTQNSKWEKVFIGTASDNAEFNKSSQYVIFKNKSDTLFIYSLTDDSITTIDKIAGYQLINILHKEYILYTRKTNDIIDLYLLETKKPFNKIHSFKGIKNWQINADLSQLWLLSEHAITLVNLNNWNYQKVYTIKQDATSYVEEFIINTITGSASFIETNSLDQQSLHYYNPKSNIHNTYRLSNRKIKHLIQISRKDDKIIFSYQNLESTHHNLKDTSAVVKVDIWNYQDVYLKSIQLKNPPIEKDLVVSINLQTELCLNLTKKGENIVVSPNGEWVFCSYLNGDRNERYWNPLVENKGFIVNTQNGNRTNLETEFSEAYFSPDSRYLICEDNWYCNWLCYDLKNRKLINITDNIPIPQKDSSCDRPIIEKSRGLILVGWLKNDKGLIFYDSYDIWLIDPQKIESPICLTNGEGRKQGITFRLINDNDLLFKTISSNNTLILSTFDQLTKENGFYSLKLGRKNVLQRISMGNCVYDYAAAPGNVPPIKAKNKFAYIVRHMSETEAPNFYCTRNFKKFFPISDLTPQKDIIWYKNKLLTYVDSDGHTSQGVLYLPEDFDSSKQYPAIINIYEKKSQEVHYFRDPKFLGGGIDLAIPWFTGRGFLIYTIDITYKIGNTGESALKAVEKGVEELCKLPYIDTSHLGIQGHSFGAYEVNYIVTHSNRFKAAMSANGVSDLISLNAQFTPGGNNHQFTNESAQIRMGGSLWEKPDAYINNSPILNADKISTPLLIMANGLDLQVPYEQGLELFTSLRRLGKPVWLLQYDGEGHVVYDKEAVIDYWNRMEQFFSHYLKSTRKAIWMTKGN